ncbi:hypothetical protein BG004_006437 [Podila humilis]|nr:hypothetical protein BG004_006437 [Podila humilis]
MNIFKSLNGMVWGNQSSPELVAVPSGQFNVIQPNMKPICRFIDAKATIKRTSMPHQYRLVVQRIYDEDEESLDDRADDDDEHSVLIDKAIEFRVGMSAGATAFSWKDFGKSPKTYEFVCAEETTAFTTSNFEINVYQCMFERCYNRSHVGAEEEAIEEFQIGSRSRERDRATTSPKETKPVAQHSVSAPSPSVPPSRYEGVSEVISNLFIWDNTTALFYEHAENVRCQLVRETMDTSPLSSAMKEHHVEGSLVSVSAATAVDHLHSSTNTLLHIKELQPQSTHKYSVHAPMPLTSDSPLTPVSSTPEFQEPSYMDVDNDEMPANTLAHTNPPDLTSLSSMTSSTTPPLATSPSLAEPLTPTTPPAQPMDCDEKTAALPSEQQSHSTSQVVGAETAREEMDEQDVGDDEEEVDEDVEDDHDDNQEGDHEKHPYTSSSSSACSSSASLRLPSIIALDESIYYAVFNQSELHIIPYSSPGFHWNEDLFLKPHQRRRLGLDAMKNKAPQSTSSGTSSGTSPDDGQGAQHAQDSAIIVHEVHLCEQDISGILPSWP